MDIIDLTHKLSGDTPPYPGDDYAVVLKNRTYEADGYNESVIRTGMHVGTHIDAPQHLLDKKQGINSYSLDSFIGNAVLIDAQDENIITLSSKCDKINAGDIVLFRTGFDRYYYRDGNRYFNEHPVLTMALAEFLCGIGIKMVGFDMPSPDRMPYMIHKYFLENGVFVLENLTNLGSVPEENAFMVHAAPLNLDCEASIVRAYAVLP